MVCERCSTSGVRCCHKAEIKKVTIIHLTIKYATRQYTAINEHCLFTLNNRVIKPLAYILLTKDHLGNKTANRTIFGQSANKLAYCHTKWSEVLRPTGVTELIVKV